MISKIFLLCVLLQVCLISARKYDRCQLAKELRDKYKFSKKDVPVWICIAQHESNFDTKAYNGDTKDYGIFQISSIYWCDLPNNSHPNGCHIPCSALHDDNIDDDVKCLRQVYDEHQRLQNNGFKAWTTYDKYCAGNVKSYVDGCNL